MIVNNTLPHAISNSKFNEYTREIFKTLNLSTGFEGSHTFRRSFATHKFNEKAPLKDIMQFTGHDKESTLLGYIHKNNVDVNNSITFS
jgi:integrase